jgi:predicted AlkP superfamily pyrophosphatase or phosphodiesterase
MLKGMLMKKMFLLVFILVTLDVMAQTPSKGQETAGNSPVKPRLVVAIIADQFRYDYLLRFGSEYSEGLKQLMTRGAVFTNAHYEHFPTFTSVGHAAFLSGALPSVTGIIGNSWYDRYSGKPVQSASDSSVQQVGGAGGPGSSPRNLLVNTIGDELKIAGESRNRVLGISLKDYSGILASGHMADAVYWFDGRSGNFVSSTYYLKELPAWVKEFNAGQPADRYKGMEWQGTKLSTETGPKLYGMLQFTPFGNELIEQMAEAAIKTEQLGQDADTDLLVLSFSSNDYVGHNNGPDSAQVRDISIATDRLLGKLFKFIDAQVGMSNVTVVFAADHGVAPMPEANAERKLPGGRIAPASVLTAAKDALFDKYGEGNWIVAAPEEAIYLDWNLIKSKNLSGQEVAAEAAKAIQALPHVFRVYTREQLTTGVPAGDRVGRRIVNSYSFRRGPDLYVLLDPYYFFGAGRSTTHGSPFGYDSHVPVIFMGPGIKAGRFNATIAVNDVAPTLATMLGIETPSGSEGRVLSEIFETK